MSETTAPAPSAKTAGRLAPSPTGAQHPGNARTYLLAWLAARRESGTVTLRIEDVDSPRVKEGAAEQAMDDLRWLGLDWDYGPDVGGPDQPYVQTAASDVYAGLLTTLQQAELVYPCTCSRSDVAAAASAPHAGQEPPPYAGTCRHRTAAEARSLPPGSFCWRFRTTASSPVVFTDLVAGFQQCDVATALGDFVVAKADGQPSYQLAVVADDHRMKITQVVRGADLIPSTFRQILLYEAFGWPPPDFAHVGLVIGPDGRRLAKRHGDTRLSVLRDRKADSRVLVGRLAWSAALIHEPEPCSPHELLAGLSDRFWALLSAAPVVWSRDDWKAVGGN